MRIDGSTEFAKKVERQEKEYFKKLEQHTKLENLLKQFEYILGKELLKRKKDKTPEEMVKIQAEFEKHKKRYKKEALKLAKKTLPGASENKQDLLGITESEAKLRIEVQNARTAFDKNQKKVEEERTRNYRETSQKMLPTERIGYRTGNLNTWKDIYVIQNINGAHKQFSSEGYRYVDVLRCVRAD